MTLFTFPDGLFGTMADFDPASVSSPSKRARQEEAPVHVPTRPHVFKPHEFKAADCVGFGTVKRNQNGGKSIPVQSLSSDSAKRRIIIQGPKMRIAFPVESEGKDYFAVDCSLDGHETSKTVMAFIECIRGLEEHVKLMACSDACTWFDKKLSMDAVNVLFKPAVKDGGASWPPVIRLKINRKSTQLFTPMRDPIDSKDVLQKGMIIVPLVEPTSVWQVSNNFGISCAVPQAIVYERPKFEDCAVEILESDNENDAPADGHVDEFGYGT